MLERSCLLSKLNDDCDDCEQIIRNRIEYIEGQIRKMAKGWNQYPGSWGTPPKIFPGMGK